MTFSPFAIFFFFHVTAPTAIYTLSLHDALPIWAILSRATIGSTVWVPRRAVPVCLTRLGRRSTPISSARMNSWRSEEHTSELQSHHDLVCRLLLEKKNIKIDTYHNITNE